MFEKIKEAFKDKDDRKYIFRFAILLAAVLAASMFYYTGPDKPLQNVAKTFSAAFGKLDTLKAASTFSSTSDKEATEMFSDYFNTPCVQSFYSECFKDYKFTTGEIYVKNNEGYCDVAINMPNITGSASELYPDGIGGIVGSTKTWTDLYKSANSSQLFQELLQARKDGKLLQEEITVRLQMVKEDDNWKIVMDSETLDKLSGGIFSSFIK